MGSLAEASTPEISDDVDAHIRTDRVVLVGGDCVLGIALLEHWASLGIAATVIGRVLTDEPTEVAEHPVIDVNRGGAVAAALAGADQLVVLGATGVRDVDGSGIGLVDGGLVEAVLQAAVASPPAHVTVVSTAFRAEDGGGRPAGGPRLPRAVTTRAALERSVVEWGSARNVPVAALRPVLCASLSARGWYDRSAWRMRRFRPSPQPTVQYVHVRDIVRAVHTVGAGRHDGQFNVAPDDVLDGAATAELADRRFGVGVPTWVLFVIDWWRWITWWSPTPPAAVRLVSANLAVDSADLRAVGWVPTHTSAEAFLVAHAPAWWPSLSARRRQDMVLGGAAAVLIGSLGGAGWGVARLWRRRSR